jgi:signal transduction histidine kinase
MNQGCAHLLQRPLEEIVGRSIVDVLGEQAFESLRRYFERVLAGEQVHYEEEVNYRGIGLRWISATYTPTFDFNGVVDGWVGVAMDITERKLAEDVLTTFSRRLIEAQEQERSRLARELHDNINQKLAMLAINLEGLKECLPSSATELEGQIEEAHEQVVSVGSDIQALSHRLHSPKLGLLGLAATAASFCREFSGQQKVEIDFQSENIPKALPEEIALCLFRVLQEALQNAAKYSGSRKFQVSLMGRADEIELTIHDSGIGFEPQEAIKGKGLGLTSMKERLYIVDGQLSIESKLRHGTTIRARVPLYSEQVLPEQVR